ncbi:MAG TPA: YebC/PmpR family DNA-binding transcriptional regulator [Dissulfurispiraceae bacterium]|nr:YebC/PmpR family DNA-binding transcriptional regulator [Dissulfurispiraceae bacterium]
MAGHSKWAQIKHKKAHTDAKRGKLFTKIVKELTIAARLGGGDADGNPRLRTAMEKAKEVNMPAENIKRAVMKGTGELPGTMYEEIMYEGYGPGGAAVLIETLTDNKVRTVSEIRFILSKNGGNLGESGCVGWMFEKKGYILIERSSADEDTLMTIALDAGAEDMKNDPKETGFEIITAPEHLDTVRKAIEKNRFSIAAAEVTMLPKSYVALEGSAADQMLRLLDALEDNDDVQNVYSNFDLPDQE